MTTEVVSTTKEMKVCNDPIPVPGDFSWMKYTSDSKMLKNMYEAISYLDLWNWLKHYEPDPNKGYMFSWCPEIHAITVQTESDEHSGSSFAYCMKHMGMIAKQGWDEYYNNIIICRNQ